MSGAIPPQPRMTEMSFWAPPTPMRKPKTKTEHWSKLRLKKNLTDASGDYIDTEGPGAVSASWDPSTTLQSHKQQSYIPSDSYTTDHMNYMTSKSRTYLPPLKTTYSQRAKEGFRFWLIERPPPTNFGKYGLGSYKTVLGIGNAPRT